MCTKVKIVVSDLLYFFRYNKICLSSDMYRKCIVNDTGNKKMTECDMGVMRVLYFLNDLLQISTISCVENYCSLKRIIFGRQDVKVLKHFKTKLSFLIEKIVKLSVLGVVLVHDTRPNYLIFIHKLCLFLHVMNRLARRETAYIASKTSLGYLNRAYFYFL